MALAIALDVIGVNGVDDGPDHFGGDMLSDFRAVVGGMEIEMDAEEAVRPFQTGRTGFPRGLRPERTGPGECEG